MTKDELSAREKQALNEVWRLTQFGGDGLEEARARLKAAREERKSLIAAKQDACDHRWIKYTCGNGVRYATCTKCEKEMYDLSSFVVAVEGKPLPEVRV